MERVKWNQYQKEYRRKKRREMGMVPKKEWDQLVRSLKQFVDKKITLEEFFDRLGKTKNPGHNS